MLTLLLVLALEVPAQRGISPAQPRTFPAPLLRHAQNNVLARLEATSMRRAAPSHDGRVQNGIVRELSITSAMSLPSTRWRGSVEVANADELRLRLDDVTLSSEATLWVYSNETEPVGFTTSLAHEGTLWTPSVRGESITLEVHDPRSGSFRIGAVADMHDIETQGTECYLGTECQIPALQELASGVGSMRWVKGPITFVCSGGLVLNRDRTFTPYFLTANHCVSTRAEASTVEVLWDYRPPNCGGQLPNRNTRPRSNGAELLVTSAATDVTLLQLSSVPGQRWFLGWTTNVPANGTPVYRFSHPLGGPQVFSTMTADMTSNACDGRPRSHFLYLTMTSGGTFGGSSGSPALIEDGKIVGQLFGGCGRDEDPCKYDYRDVDGLFAQSYPLLQPFLAPTCGACVPNTNTACLIAGRFRVTMSYANRFAQPSISRAATVFEPRLGTSDSHAFFSFESASVDAGVRVLDGTQINGMWWIHAYSFDSADVSVVVTDTRTCETWNHLFTHGETRIVDREAFPSP